MNFTVWLSNNYIEIFGAVTGILYVFLEIKQNPLLWPVGIVTSGVYIYVFFTGKLYADMGLQTYYVVISILGWYWWVKGIRHKGENHVTINENKVNNPEGEKTEKLNVTRLQLTTGIKLAVVFILLYSFMWVLLRKLTDSPVPAADSFITSLSIIATWMLARKIYEHWFLWIVVNSSMIVLCLFRGLYPTLVLYAVYGTMSFAGLKAWSKTIKQNGR
jgi:nicotinamide mononucleotide transporter